MGKEVKGFRPYEEQIDVLRARGMIVPDRAAAMKTLQSVNYYRLSGYAYPFRTLVGGVRESTFFPGTHFNDVVALYEFDARLRAATFAALMPIELAVRALLGHGLGRVDPCAHLDPSKLGPLARTGGAYSVWHARYQRELKDSREEFVDHHRVTYGGRLPVWAAVELLDWGSLTYLFDFAPRAVQDEVADACGLSAPQLRSWMKALNLVRNTCAHHGRLFNRVHTLTPKLPRPGLQPDLDSIRTDWNRTFGQLTMVQFLGDRIGSSRGKLLPAVLASSPEVQRVPVSHVGAPAQWRSSSRLWAS